MDSKIEKWKQLFEATGFQSSKIHPVPAHIKTQKPSGKEIVPNRESGFLCPVPQPGSKGLMSQAHMQVQVTKIPMEAFL